MKLTIVIVNYNVKYYVEQCLYSLRPALDNMDAEVYVVDNHSADGSIEYLRTRFDQWEHPKVHFIESSHNLGFARANNLAIRQAQSDYILLLNPDTFVAENTIRTCVDFMDQHPDCGGVGVCMSRYDGAPAKESRRGLPTPMTAFYKLSGLCDRFPNSRRFGHYHMSYLPWDKPAEIEVVSGAYFMLRKQTVDKVGPLDEDFFMYGEDIDLSFRILKGGYHNWYLPVRIYHYKGESTHKSSFRYVHVFYNAMLIFFRKHYGHMSILLSIPIKGAIYGRALLAVVNMQLGLLKKSLGFLGKRSKTTPVYIFLVAANNEEQSRRFAKRRGLDAQFYIADAATYPKGHHDHGLNMKPIPENQIGYIVYDVTAYTYGQILECFAISPSPNTLIATYLPEQDMLITAEDVMT